MALVQFATPDMPDNDGYYHINMAWLMRTEGLKPDFPWLPLSILNEAEFYDLHFLFHVALDSHAAEQCNVLRSKIRDRLGRAAHDHLLATASVARAVDTTHEALVSLSTR